MLILAFVLMLILKLAGVIAWSWWVVFAPIIVAVSLFTYGFILMFSIARRMRL